mmetsp:Transcript_79878/g.185475  ORF Transcript_79878/g.185475 Transcript_79878/m.185475 type:complete len:91 (+) Transcript_79878:2-274(+)
MGGVDYGAATRISGEAHVSVSVTGDTQTLEGAKGKTVVVHSTNGHRVACGMIETTEVSADPAAETESDGAARGAWNALASLLVLAWAFCL